jgi:hypothetical protein
VHQQGWSVGQNQNYSPQIVLAVSSSFFNRPGKATPVVKLAVSEISQPARTEVSLSFNGLLTEDRRQKNKKICINLIDFCAYTAAQFV